MAVPPLAAASSPVQLTGFSLSPSCTHPGGTVTANVTVQNTTLSAQTFYAQDWVTAFGVTLTRGSAVGPNTLPPLYSASQGQATQVPSYTPYGYYTVNLGVGPSSTDPTSWGQRSAALTVSPFC
jgi:hypothetical protein